MIWRESKTRVRVSGFKRLKRRAQSNLHLCQVHAMLRLRNGCTAGTLPRLSAVLNQSWLMMVMFTSISRLRTPARSPRSLSCEYGITEPVVLAALPKKALERPRLGTATQRKPRTEKRGLLAKRRSAPVLALRTEEVVQVYAQRPEHLDHIG